MKKKQNQTKKIYNLELLKQIARQNIQIDDKVLIYELARKVNYPCYFSSTVSKAEFNNNLDSRHNNHKIFNSTLTPKHLEMGKLNVEIITKKMTNIYAKLINQYKFEN